MWKRPGRIVRLQHDVDVQLALMIHWMRDAFTGKGTWTRQTRLSPPKAVPVLPDNEAAVVSVTMILLMTATEEALRLIMKILG